MQKCNHVSYNKIDEQYQVLWNKIINFHIWKLLNQTNKTNNNNLQQKTNFPSWSFPTLHFSSFLWWLWQLCLLFHRKHLSSFHRRQLLPLLRRRRPCRPSASRPPIDTRASVERPTWEQFWKKQISIVLSIQWKPLCVIADSVFIRLVCSNWRRFT